MRSDVLYITVFLSRDLTKKFFSFLLRPFGQYLYGFHELNRLFDPALQLLAL